MSVLELNNVKVFNLSSGKSLSQFIAESLKTKKSLRYNAEYRERLELIQDFEFPTASSRVHISSDGEYIAASGVYPPQLRLFETTDLSMKFQRNLDSEIVQFAFLTSDYKKIAMLCTNRTIELHAQYGKHYTTRVPRFGRDMCYNPYTCELLIVGATSETYRLNLEQGRFMASLESQVCEEFNCTCMVADMPWVLATGGINGLVECWDLRQHERAALVDCKHGEITALAFEKLMMATGHNDGTVNLFDIRFPKSLLTVTHKNKMPIKAVKFHNDFMLSCDFKALKISQIDGKILTTIESNSSVNDFEIVKETGMVLVANETQRVGIYYLPALGPAPKWCSFVEALNDQVEEQPVNVMDGKQFVTVEELEKINGSDLIGSEMMQGYMHGYLLDSKLYYKLKALAEPFDYKEYRKERIAKKLEEKTAERITIRKKLPKVNKSFAAAMMNEEIPSKKGKDLLEDPRFTDLFTDQNYEINQESEDFRRLNRKRMIEPNAYPDVFESEDSDLPIVPKLKKKRKIERGLVEEPNEQGDDQVFRDAIDGVKKEKKAYGKRERKSKVLKEKPDLDGRRTIVPMQKLLSSVNKNYR